MEVIEANRREAEIEAEAEAAERAAYLEYNEATKEAFAEYERVWLPAKAKWEAFQEPHFKRLQERLVAIQAAKMEALSEVRRNWGNCPRCGTPTARYQVFCLNDKCRINLLLEQE